MEIDSLTLRSISQGVGTRIGIIAGSGPDAGIDLWTKLLKSIRSKSALYSGDIDAPNVTIFSIPALGLSMDLETYFEIVREHLFSAIRAISQRVDVVCIACNTLHVFEPEIRESFRDIHFASMVEAASSYVRTRGIERVALLCSSVTARSKVYERLLQYCQIEFPADLAVLDRLILEFKRNPDDHARLCRDAGRLVETLDANHVLLACTELPMLLSSTPLERTAIDVTALLADDLASLYLNNCIKAPR